MAAVQKTIDAVAALEKYEHGFTSDIETEYAPKGLSAKGLSPKRAEPATKGLSPPWAEAPRAPRNLSPQDSRGSSPRH